MKKNLNETKERGWFGSLDDNHVLYLVLYTATSLPMMPRPGTRVVISALFACSLVSNNIFPDRISTVWDSSTTTAAKF